MEKKASSEKEVAINTRNTNRLHYIVGIGASAGGLEAIHELFDNMPPDTNFSFIIVQHLSPDYKSLMAELLSKHTQMKVSEAEDDVLVKPNCVYVIPSKKLMTLRHGKLRLTEKKTAAIPNNAIDVFLHSLAEEQGDRAIAIILSGTGTDGTRGIDSIKKTGGIVVVQDPATAKFDGMPNSAIASGNIDLILPPELMPEEIFKFIKQGRLLRYFDNQPVNAEEACIGEILALVRINTSNDFTAYKLHTIKRRIMRRMVQQDIPSLTAYLDFLRINPAEVETLSKDFLIGVTKFFRDTEAWEVIRKQVLPAIIDNKTINDQVKIWVAACSTGEEAYTLAILIKEYLVKQKLELNVKIFATDIDKHAVEFAAKGIYNNNISKDISPERLNNFFTKEGSKYLINQHIRKMVIFANHDIIKDPPYSKIDLVSCRNMLIYMNPGLQKRILSTFHFSLNISGYLFLGTSENPGDLASELEEVSRKWKVYKNVRPSQNFVMDSLVPAYHGANKELNKAVANKTSKLTVNNQLTEMFNDVLAEEFGYAGILVNESNDLIQAVGEYKKYLNLPEKRLHFNLLKLVPEDLSVALGVGLRKALKNDKKITINRVRWKDKNNIRFVNMVIKPFLLSRESSLKYLFILFYEDSKRQVLPEETETSTRNVADLEYFKDLEIELKETKAHLHAAVEELETSNEELQSSNEELISSNEELQSTNEELQSLNEELHTVNTEHQLKIKELIELNDDLNNYFRSTEIGQIFVDSNLVIRKYTPAIINQINIIETDIGRPINHFSYNLKYTSLVRDIKQVIKDSKSIEREVELMDGRFYLMRILPYIRLDRKTDGVVITFVDITTLKNLNLIISSVLNSSLNGIMAFKSIRDKSNKIIDFEWVLANDSSEQLLERSKGTLVGKRLLQQMPGNREEGLFDKYVEVVETGKALHLEHFYDHEGIKTWFETVAIKMEDGLAITFADISEKKEAEERLLRAYEDVKQAEVNLINLNNELEKRVQDRTRELSLSEERFRLVSLATNDVIWDWNLVSNEFWWSNSLQNMLGHNPEAMEKGIESWYNRLHPDDKERVIEGINHVINLGGNQWSDEFRYMKADGKYAYLFGRGYVLQNEYGIPYRMLGSLVDLTNLKKVQDELERTNQDLVKINEDLDNFVYTASHDLRAPIINLDGLLKNLGKHLNTESQDVNFILDLMKTTIDKFKNTINDLTDISRIQRNKQEDVRWIDLSELTEDIFVNIRDMLISSKADVQIDFSECKKIKFSKKNLYSILFNLMSNAIKYRSPERPPQVKVKTKLIDGYVLLSVEDNGLGISEKHIKNLFTMFKRFHDHVDGSGVGLYIVKRIIENAGGSIEVESHLGKGTTFYVYLPRTVEAR
ncbi:chemotaxis protein CheB [Rhodocytophaga aerolata]|uniref:histidine kinase n=1 Tax=Rhodocytophaga aerolata TaxID=455078 RepID=A0ABT8R6J9_9BACT|nr:chemotaxis protein CheB [Rhodocytophaga aerolata]MDO1447723.1 chemotaxis protein CheB [Rhodocytophaga aerolata]